MHSDLGYFGDETCRLEPLDNLFAKLCPGRGPADFGGGRES